MKPINIRCVALMVIVTFIFMNVCPEYMLSQGKDDIRDDIEKVKLLIEYDNYKNALEILDRIIPKCEAEKDQYREELCNSYYLKARIFFSAKDKSEIEAKANLEAVLVKLFKINADYPFPPDESEAFINVALAIRQNVKFEVTIQVERNPQDSQDIYICIDDAELKNLEPLTANAYKIDLTYGSHAFYFVSKNKEGYILENRDIKKDEIYSFNIDFSKKNNVKSTEGIIPKAKRVTVKKKFPWLIVGAVVVAGVIAYFLLSKKSKSTLTITVGEGVDGTPAPGTTQYKKGATVNYSYTLKNGYSGLSVKLDGQDVPASGMITMNGNHSLTASATKTYTLTVTKGNGVDGTPASGTFTYNAGDTVNYSYTALAGYRDLVVKINGLDASSSGAINLSANHTLTATAGKTYTLSVTRGIGVKGDPNTGTIICKEGEPVSYDYALEDGYTNLVVTLDGAQANSDGTITMDRDHTLVVTASLEINYTLTVTKGDGVDGNPISGIFKYSNGNQVTYNYTLQTGYYDLIVILDGTRVGNSTGANGTINMNENHTLSASATKKYKLTVAKGTGVKGTPDTGTYYYKAGEKVGYSYEPESGYRSVTVLLDEEGEKPSSGTIDMVKNQKLSVTANPF